MHTPRRLSWISFVSSATLILSACSVVWVRPTPRESDDEVRCRSYGLPALDFLVGLTAGFVGYFAAKIEAKNSGKPFSPLPMIPGAVILASAGYGIIALPLCERKLPDLERRKVDELMPRIVEAARAHQCDEVGRLGAKIRRMDRITYETTLAPAVEHCAEDPLAPAVMEGLNSARGMMARCVLQLRASPLAPPEAKIDVQFDKNGHVTDVVGKSLPAGDGSRCLVDALKGATFPNTPAGGAFSLVLGLED